MCAAYYLSNIVLFNISTKTLYFYNYYILISILSNLRLTISNISIIVTLLIIISTRLVSILIYLTLKRLTLLFTILTLYSFNFIYY